MPDRRFAKANPEKIKVKKNRSNYFLIILFLIFLVLVFFVIWQRQEKWKINKIIVENNLTIDETAFSEYSLFLLDNYHNFAFIPRGNFLFFREHWLKNNILADWPQIQDLIIKKGANNKEKIIIINERLPENLWCRDGSFTDCFYVDIEGLIYDKAPIFSEGIFLKIFTDNVNYEVGEKILNFEEIKKIKKLIQDLKSINIDVTNLKIIDEKRVSLGIEKISDVKIPSDSMIIIKKEMTSKQVIERLKLVSSAPDFRNKLALNPAKLEYVDLRFENSIVYKFEDNE